MTKGDISSTTPYNSLQSCFHYLDSKGQREVRDITHLNMSQYELDETDWKAHGILACVHLSVQNKIVNILSPSTLLKLWSDSIWL